MVKYIIFDLGGVVFQSGTAQAIRTIAQQLNLTEEAVASFLREDSEYGGKYRKGEITKEEFWKAALESWKKEIDWRIPNDIWMKSYRVRQDMVELIKSLHNNGYILGVLSNTVEDRFNHINQQMNIYLYFSQRVLSYKDHVLKPDRKAFLLIMQKLNIGDPHEAIYIDDKEIHANVARDLGMHAIVYQNTDQLKNDLRKLGVKI